jgi:hypothetical protein
VVISSVVMVNGSGPISSRMVKRLPPGRPDPADLLPLRAR